YHHPPHAMMVLGGVLPETSNNHDFTQKDFLGATVPGRTASVNNAYQDLFQTIDIIFNDPNTPPFICKQLIQMLVTSNPSPGYLNRVVQMFKNNGQGVRGDLQAVVRAILTDAEARGDVKTAPTYGRLRDPIQYQLNILRAFNATSFGGTT